MEITLTDIAKKFSSQWLFRGINHCFKSKTSTAIVGSNGSGKSTLIQIIYGFQMPSKGSIVHAFDGRLLETEHVPMHSAFVAPYVELPEELTLKEAFDFHSKFKKMNKAFTFDDLVSEALLTGSEYKMIRYFSSGMKQRIKLLMAFFSESDLLLLDEPCSNLDEQGIEWYRNMIKHHAAGKTIIVASNQKSEYEFCTEELVLNHFR